MHSQEGFRYAVYMLLDKTSAGLAELAGDSLVTHNKPVLAYVSGLGFGLISGVNELCSKNNVQRNSFSLLSALSKR